jgi:hypothetical protein
MQEVGLADAIETQEYMYNCMPEVGLADAIETQEYMFDLTACGAGGLTDAKGTREYMLTKLHARCGPGRRHRNPKVHV